MCFFSHCDVTFTDGLGLPPQARHARSPAVGLVSLITEPGGPRSRVADRVSARLSGRGVPGVRRPRVGFPLWGPRMRGVQGTHDGDTGVPPRATTLPVAFTVSRSAVERGMTSVQGSPQMFFHHHLLDRPWSTIINNLRLEVDSMS